MEKKMEKMMDPIERQAAIDALNVGAELLRRVLDEANVVGAERAKYEWGLGLIESYISDVKELPSAQPNNQVNLCDSCKYSYPDCPSEADDVIFGNGKGNDNICACNKYLPSAQPEIILCKDCEHWKNEHLCERLSRFGSFETEADFYCGYGKRRS